jgi:transcriptional regulator with XRE-family HTH domain
MAVTARSKFAEELRAHRDRMVLTQAQLARKANISLSLVKKIEQGERRPQADFAAWCDEFFGCPGTFARFQELTLLEQFPEWFASRIPYEEKASVITEWDMRVIPGLLQAPAYAQAIIRACRPFASAHEQAKDVEARLERQEILRRSKPPKFWALLAEGTLRQVVGGLDVMREQLAYLAELIDSSRVVIQVLSSSAPDAPGADGPVTVFEFENRQPVAYLEGWGSARLVEDSPEVTEIAMIINMIKGCALSPGDSRSLILKIRDELCDAPSDRLASIQLLSCSG